jgi:hypothetical protein
LLLDFVAMLIIDVHEKWTAGPVPALTSVAGLVLGCADAKNGSALVIARNRPWKSHK